MTEAYDWSESCYPPFAFSQSVAIAVSMSWLLLKTSNIFFSGSCGKNLFECFKSRTVICCSSVWTRRWTTKKRSGYITCCERIRKASCNIRTRFNRNRVFIWCFNSSGYLDRATVSVLGYFCLCWFTWVFRILLTVFLVISIIRNWVSKTFEIMIIVIWWRTKIKCYPVVWCNQFSSVFL